MAEHLPDTNVGNIEYIRKADAIKQCGFGMTSLHIANNLRKIPPADVVPVVHGRWIEDEGEGYHGIHCSRCNFSIPYGNVMMGYNFCPKCGAKMDGGKS